MSFLPREFYARDTVTVAKGLLGKKIVRKIGNRKISGIITETEAYRHKDDPASHAFRKKTERNRAMFEEVGRAYVYFTYGMYFCFNVVARNSRTEAGAVLIRSIQPEKGVDVMKKNRKKDELKNLTDGPAKLAQALDINKKQYGVD
ncbi:MAG: DNA-3-methyladenine glycosylase, partial [Nitrosopumilaceae archaeon]